MADDDATFTATSDAPTPEQETDVNKELFGGKKPEDYTGVPKAQSAQDPNDPQQKGPEDTIDERLKEENRIYEENTARAKEAGERYRANYDRVQEIEAQYRAEGKLQPPKLQQPLTFGQFEEQQQQAQAQLKQQQARNPYTIIGNIVSLAAVGAAVFGHSRNPWANAALMSGAGAFMSNFAKGQTEAGKEQLELWNKNNEEIQKQNKEETEDYHNILANRRLNLSEQMALIRDLAASRQDWKLYDAAARNSVAEAMKILQYKDKAHEYYAKTHVNVVQQVINNWLQKTTQGKSWAAWVLAKSGGKINPLRSTEEYMKAYNDDKLSPGAWTKETKGTSIDTEEKKAGDTDTAGALPHLSSDADINALANGAHFIGPDGLEHIKNW